MDTPPPFRVPLEAHAAVAKVSQYASRESGDTVEAIERPRGGVSLIVADGQRSGRSAKAISNVVVQKCVTLLAEGVRDGAVARAAHDALQLQRGGQVSAELTIVSVDLETRTLVVSRNARCPSILVRGGALEWLDAPSEPVGIYPRTKPTISEFPLEAGMILLVFSDGVWRSGSRSGAAIEWPALLAEAAALDAPSVAERILAEALRLDNGRPHDDATVLVVTIGEATNRDNVRRMEIRFQL